MTNSLTTWKGVDVSSIDFTYEHKEQCPKCASEGGDRSGDNLHVYGLDDDGRSLGSYCFRCNFTVPSDEFLEEVGNSSFSGNFDKKGESMISKRDEEKLKEKSLTPEQLAEIYNKTSDTLTVKYRGLDAEVCKQLGVRWKYSDDGKVSEMWFPCHIYENGELKTVGYKIRKQNKVFDVKGYVGKLCLMGNQTNYVAETLIVVAGEIDLVTAVKALQNKVNGSGKYKSISCNIVTPLLGEPHIADDLKSNYEWVNKHQKVVICTDDDKAGHEALENIKKVLPSEKTFVVSLRHKDLNEYIDPRYNGGDSIANGNIKITQDVYWDSKPLEDFGVIGSDQLRQKARDRLNQDKIPFPKFLSGLAKHFTDGSMWTGEWVNLIAPTSVGKSSVTDAWMIDWSLNSPYRQAVMSYEAGAEDYGVKVSSLATGKAIFKIEGKDNRIKFIDDNADIIDKLLITEDGLPRFDFIESLPTSVEKLKKQIMYLIKIRNIRVLWIDPILDLLAIAKGSKADYDDIILFFENVRTNHHVTIMSILHTRKSLSSGGNGSDGAEVSEEDAYGGRELISKGTINITASRNKNAEDWVERNTTKLTIRKSRTDQVTGVHALLFYRAKANKLYPFEYAEEHDFWKHELSMKVEDIIIDDDVGFDLAIIGDDDLGDDGDGEQIFEDLSNSTAQLVDTPDW